MSNLTRRVRILRFKSGFIDPPRFQDFEVLVTPEMTVLDALEHLRLEQDATLMYRHSCHHSSCGTCACKINGQPRLACVTRVAEIQADVITLEPLDGFRCKGDLVVDMTGFYDYIPDEWSYLRVSESAPTATRFENCIECGACVSACPVIQLERPFMGPAALAALHRELEKSPEQRANLLTIAGSEQGERWCERAIACSRACPMQVAPARHIFELRQQISLAIKSPG